MEQGEPGAEAAKRDLRGQQDRRACRIPMPAAPFPGCGIWECPAACLARPGAGHVRNPGAGAALELHVNRKSPLLKPRAVPAARPCCGSAGPRHCRPEQPAHLNCFRNGPKNSGSSLHLSNKYTIKQPRWLREAKQSTLPKQGGCSY